MDKYIAALFLVVSLLSGCVSPESTDCCPVSSQAEYCPDEMDICQGSDTRIQGKPVKLRAPAYIEMCKRDFNPTLCPADLNPDAKVSEIEHDR